MYLLGIDTSCDDTSAAIVENGIHILSSVVTSQDQFHKKYGGVVPEIASRKHLELITLTIEEALQQAELTLDDIDGVAVTNRPGLIGSLVIGISAAKSISYTKKIPLTAVNHLQGHAYAPLFDHNLVFPHLSLIVSGGHTLTAIVRKDWSLSVIGHTRDDAAGECLDKVSKMLGLGYPGGKVIDELSRLGDADSFEFPRPMMHSTSDHFSFSGLKTAVRVFLEKNSPDDYSLNDLVASVQEAVMEVLEHKARKAAVINGLKLITVSGGVAANNRLRQIFNQRASEKGITVCFPPPALCTDNAAAIAGIGYFQIKQGNIADYTLDGKSRATLVYHSPGNQEKYKGRILN